jgi:hypothetical protein
MKKTIKFLWWSIIFWIFYAFIFGVDFLEYFIPKDIFYALHIGVLKDFALIVPFIILFTMGLMLILLFITIIKNRKNRIQNTTPNQ